MDRINKALILKFLIITSLSNYFWENVSIKNNQNLFWKAPHCQLCLHCTQRLLCGPLQTRRKAFHPPTWLPHHPASWPIWLDPSLISPSRGSQSPEHAQSELGDCSSLQKQKNTQDWSGFISGKIISIWVWGALFNSRTLHVWGV